MKKLDWYILKKFLTTFFFTVFLFAVVAVVVDVSEKTDDFVKSKLGFIGIVTQYYYGFIPHIIALLFPLFVFIPVIFFTSKMAGRSEIIAILASGTSFARFLRPYWVGGLLLATILFFADKYVIPKANQIRGTFEAKYIDANNSYNALVGGNSNNLYIRIDSFTFAGIMNYDTLNKRSGPFFMHRIINNKLTINTRADNLHWDTTARKWVLDNLIERTLKPLGETVIMQHKRVLNFNFKPLDLSRDKYTKDKLTSPELSSFIKLEEQRGAENLNELKVELYRRDAICITVLLLTLMGAIVASKKVRGGSGSHLAIGIIIAVAFIVVGQFSTVFSTKGNLPPLIAAWLPNVMFMFVAIYMYQKAPK